MEPDEKSKNKPKNDKAKRGWRDLPATPQRLASLFQEQQLPESAWKPAHQFAGLTPTGKDWLRFVDIFLSATGTIFLLAGIVFFFAFNWDDLSKWHRFAVVEGAVILATVLAFFFNIDKWAGRLALGAATILMGVALAVISQEYQTGADSYRLFQIWLMLITGWVLISRWNIMYLIWMILFNITIGLYWQQVIYSDWITFNLIVLAANAGFVFLWDGIAKVTRFKFMVDGRWFLYIFMLVALAHGTTMMGDYIFGAYWMEARTMLQPVAYFTLLACALAFYTLLRRDLLMLTFSALSFLVVALMWSGYNIHEFFYNLSDRYLDTGFYIFYFFVMAIITIGLTVLMVTQLRRLHQHWEANHD